MSNSNRTVMLPGAEHAAGMVVVDKREAGVAVVELNREQKRNALSQALIDELIGILRTLDRDTEVRAVVLTSSSQSPFCAGADIKELSTLSTAEAHQTGWLRDLEEGFTTLRKPIIAAVQGYAFGGGFEMALMCDMLYASADAHFGFPEIKLGTLPGAGGTQRLTRAIGKQKAMKLILTGDTIPASEMERYGVVSCVAPMDSNVVEEAVKLARTIASYSVPVVGLAKQAVKAAETTTLTSGLELERTLYYSSFSLRDCKEGIAAFLEKRSPNFADE